MVTGILCEGVDLSSSVLHQKFQVEKRGFVIGCRVCFINSADSYLLNQSCVVKLLVIRVANNIED